MGIDEQIHTALKHLQAETFCCQLFVPREFAHRFPIEVHKKIYDFATDPEHANHIHRLV